jgi:hypothetical protein
MNDETAPSAADTGRLALRSKPLSHLVAVLKSNLVLLASRLIAR